MHVGTRSRWRKNDNCEIAFPVNLRANALLRYPEPLLQNRQRQQSLPQLPSIEGRDNSTALGFPNRLKSPTAFVPPIFQISHLLVLRRSASSRVLCSAGMLLAERIGAFAWF